MIKSKASILLLFLYGLELFSQVPLNGLVSFYPFTGNANDESGNEHHGNVRGAVLTTDRCNVENSAFAFDGGNNYIDIGDITEFDGSNALTISAWIYTEGISDEHSGTIISKYNTFGHSERVFIFDVARYQENSLRFAMYGADGNSDWEQEIATVPIPLSVWNHVVVTWDGISHNIEFYINGIKVNSDYSQNGNRPTRIYDKSSTLMIGASESGYTSPDYLFNGSIDEILTYTRVLTQEEILSLYYYDCETRSSVAFYPFNGNANDALDGGNDGVVHGPVLTTDRCGISNSAYLFDGIDDYISLDPSYIISQSTGTFAAWVYFNSLNSTQYLGCIGDIHSQDHYLSLVRFDPVYGTFTIFRRKPGMADIIAGSTTVTSNQWYFVVMTSDGNEWNLYVNGKKEELTVVSGQNTGDWAHELTGVDNWLLGCIDIQEPHDPAFLNGKLDDVRIYDYALTHAEILALYTYDCLEMQISGINEVCRNQQNVHFSATYMDNMTYSWSYSGTGATISGNLNEVQIDFSENATSGDLRLVSVKEGQSFENSLSITLLELPGLSQNISGRDNVCRSEGPYNYRIAEIENAEVYLWIYDGQEVEISGNSNSVTLYFHENSTSGSLSVSGVNQCGSGPVSENFPIIVNDCDEIIFDFNIPNSFSPNGDNINDFFIIQGLKEGTVVRVFNRNGKLLFESENYENNWDGLDKDGKKLKTDTYWYIISIPGIETDFKGFLYLKE